MQRHKVMSLETVRSLANGPSWGAEGKVCILRSPGISASPISLLSMGGVCGQSLTAGKKFSSLKGKQTPSIWHYESVIHSFYDSSKWI